MATLLVGISAEHAGRIIALSRAASREGDRPVLNAMQFEWVGQDLEVIATDSYRLALRKFGLSTFQADEDGACLLPRKPLVEALESVVKALPTQVRAEPDTIAIEFNPDGATIAVAVSEIGVSFHVRSVDGTFPTWRQLMPEAPARSVAGVTLPAFNGNYLADAIKCAATTAAKQSGLPPLTLAASTSNGDAHLKPWLFEINEQDFGPYQYLLMPVRT